LQGGVTIAFSIAPGGSVSGASVASSSLGNARVEGCILRQARRLKFPAADKPTNANYPFVFRPAK
jgi:TonB family protein